MAGGNLRCVPKRYTPLPSPLSPSFAASSSAAYAYQPEPSVLSRAKLPVGSCSDNGTKVLIWNTALFLGHHCFTSEFRVRRAICAESVSGEFSIEIFYKHNFVLGFIVEKLVDVRFDEQ